MSCRYSRRGYIIPVSGSYFRCGTSLSRVVMTADIPQSSIAADVLLHLLTSLDIGPTHPFGTSSNMTNLISSTLRDLGARSTGIEADASLNIPAMSIGRERACGFIARLTGVAAIHGHVSMDDAASLAKSLVILAVDPATSSSLAYTIGQALASLWPIWLAKMVSFPPADFCRQGSS
jgi:hypothetical protein